MLPCIRIPLLAALLLGAAGTLTAQSTALSPSPTLPSDTLEANFAPRSAAGPTPDLAPSLPSDTLKATEPVDSFPTNSQGGLEPAAPQNRGDSAALRELRSWMDRHPGLMSPPPRRAVLVRL